MAFEVNFPIAFLPTGRGIPMAGPMNEQDVPLKRESKPEKKAKKPDRAYSGIPLWVSNGRSPQPIKGMPVEKAWPGEGTGVGYNGPFVPDEGVSEETNTSKDSSRLPFKIPERQFYIEPGKDTIVSKALRPDDDELEAARNGMRWHWALEHRFMPPGSKWNETVWQGADRENAWLAHMLKQQAADKGTIMSPIAQVRTRQQIQSQYDKLVAEYLGGNWDDPARAYEDFAKEADRLREKFAKAGFDPEQLRMPPPVAGRRSGFTTQSRPLKLREQYNFAKTVNDEISTWLEPGENGKRKIDDPEFVNSKKVYLDSVYERLLKHIKDSSNSMADEEKQRLQILVLPDDAMDEVIKEVQGFQAALRGIMASASAKDWSQNNRGKVNEVIEATGFEPSRDKATLGRQLAALGGTLVDSFSSNDELPHDVATDLQAAKTKFDRYMKNMMLSASVAPHLVANLSALLGNTVAAEYNNQAQVASRGKADLLEPVTDISEQIPKNAMPLSELIKHSDYIWPSLAKMPKGRVSTNPESVGENEPVNTASVPGVSFED